MKKRYKTVQVFTQGDKDFCEVDGILLDLKVSDGFVTIKSLAEDGSDKSVWTHVFPISFVTMVRIHEQKGK